ncbi:MAG TPA: hypothetical protein VLN59_02430, partial [Burkholderiales bacterium]|nr:hypothetical protein [Burkholderiales bacterium]
MSSLYLVSLTLDQCEDALGPVQMVRTYRNESAAFAQRHEQAMRHHHRAVFDNALKEAAWVREASGGSTPFISPTPGPTPGNPQGADGRTQTVLPAGQRILSRS